ncbi:hypothetical protein UFOVP147_54 [uncultured Caudovirales phage]|uniref:Uncharacterized protein n=1 Tax=uncultured Caudovirales phage TaxID=2100421 RepID=A0A6J7W1M1_9CAUD|nr:hypothetical protein UFOVP147_54 [uncultured Caudovirales phage]
MTANCLTCKSLGRVYDEPRYACIQFHPCVNGDKYAAREAVKMWESHGAATEAQSRIFDTNCDLLLAAERERCAAICESLAVTDDSDCNITRRECAEAIRACT